MLPISDLKFIRTGDAQPGSLIAVPSKTGSIFGLIVKSPQNSMSGILRLSPSADSAMPVYVRGVGHVLQVASRPTICWGASLSSIPSATTIAPETPHLAVMGKAILSPGSRLTRELGWLWVLEYCIRRGRTTGFWPKRVYCQLEHWRNGR